MEILKQLLRNGCIDIDDHINNTCANHLYDSYCGEVARLTTHNRCIRKRLEGSTSIFDPPAYLVGHSGDTDEDAQPTYGECQFAFIRLRIFVQTKRQQWQTHGTEEV